ncbi:MAG: arylsulfatase [Crocinitomicaceae bacterium]|nr:arylsulfatase [Crocinitomicaceae bacterium]
MTKNIYKRTLLFSLLALTIGCHEENNSNTNPNIIFVLTDDLGYGDISAYEENNKIKTPNIDSIAHKGLLFTDAHTPSSVCTPTRYGLLTGRYGWRTKLKMNTLSGTSTALIPNSRSTIASILKSKGYHTAFIGKWHLGWDWAKKNENEQLGAGWNEEDFRNIDFSTPPRNTPNDLGFDYSFGHHASLDMAPYVYLKNGMVTEVPDTSTVNTGKYSWWRIGPTSKDFIHEDVTPNFFRRAIQYIEMQSKSTDPFFLYLALPSPHTPILPTKEWQGKSQLNPYGDFVMMIDDYMGKLMTAMKENGIEENTILVFTSDNGCAPAAKIEEMIEKGHHPNSIYRGHKADIFEGGHRVPFLMKWPDKIKKGTSSDETICLTDMMATFAEIVNHDLKDGEGEDSYSLMPILNNDDYSSPLREATVHHSINGSFAIRKDNWKLIMCPGSGGWSYPTPNDHAALAGLPKVQLYDLSQDPREKNNLESMIPNKVSELKSLLIQYILQGRSTPGAAQKNDAIDFEWKQINFATERNSDDNNS